MKLSFIVFVVLNAAVRSCDFQGRRSKRMLMAPNRRRRAGLSTDLLIELACGRHDQLHGLLPRDVEAASSVGVDRKTCRRARSFTVALLASQSRKQLLDRFGQKDTIRGVKVYWDETGLRMHVRRDMVQRLFPTFQFKDDNDDSGCTANASTVAQGAQPILSSTQANVRRRLSVKQPDANGVFANPTADAPRRQVPQHLRKRKKT